MNPVPQGRPVVTFRHGRSGAHTFTPDKNREFYEEFRWRVREAGIRRPFDGPLRLNLRFWRRCRQNARGDLSNFIKTIEDAGNGFLWVDDVQIAEIHAKLVEYGKDVRGRIELEIVRLEDKP
jgi:Holliday junction resolvase RusA-like endonuclease